jgi:hypothetical protein
MTKYILIALMFISCTKPKTEKQELLENKTWYLYKEVTPTEVVNHSKQYWFKAVAGKFTDYDRFQGTYSFKKDTFIIYIPNYGYNKYIVDQITTKNLVLKQSDKKGITYRELSFYN